MRLNAVLNALSDSYPSDNATADTGSLPFASRSPASNIRQRVRYSSGALPTACLNFCENTERDIPARSASVCTVQRFAGSSCIAFIALESCLSASAANQPLVSRAGELNNSRFLTLKTGHSGGLFCIFCRGFNGVNCLKNAPNHKLGR